VCASVNQFTDEVVWCIESVRCRVFAFANQFTNESVLQQISSLMSTCIAEKLSYSNNANTCKCCQTFMIITYVNNKSSSFHSSGVGYTIQYGL